MIYICIYRTKMLCSLLDILAYMIFQPIILENRNTMSGHSLLNNKHLYIHKPLIHVYKIILIVLNKITMVTNPIKNSTITL